MTPVGLPRTARLGLRALGAAAAIVLIAVPALSTPAFAQTPMDDPLDARDARRVDRMEKVVRELRDIVFKAQRTGSPVVVQPADTDARLADLATKISDLEGSLTRLNGSLETTAHDLDQARRENTALRAQVKALSDRLTADEQKAAEAMAAAAQAAAPPAAVEPPPPADPRAAAPPASTAFAKARQMMLSGDYDAAEAAFGDYVSTYPDTPRTPEARYWWGKTLSVRGDYVKAASAYIGAIRGWPQTAWAPDAVVELGRALVQLKKPGDACQTLTELGRKYPKAAASVASRAQAVRLQAKCT
jgi:tol-pal system protein YbgF